MSDGGPGKRGLPACKDVEGVARLRTLARVGRHDQTSAIGSDEDYRGYLDCQISVPTGSR